MSHDLAEYTRQNWNEPQTHPQPRALITKSRDIDEGDGEARVEVGRLGVVQFGTPSRVRRIDRHLY